MLIELSDLILFIGASILLTLSPGPDNLYVFTLSLQKNLRVALLTTLGLMSGIIVHTTLAAFGISAIFQTSETIFTLFKFLGAGYLIYLGYLTFKHRNTPLDTKVLSIASSLWHAYFKGLGMNLLNPKVSLFFLAFLPQFVSYDTSSMTASIFLLGGVFILQATLIFGLIALLAHYLGQRILHQTKLISRINTLSAFIFLGFGVRLAFEKFNA